MKFLEVYEVVRGGLKKVSRNRVFPYHLLFLLRWCHCLEKSSDARERWESKYKKQEGDTEKSW